MLGPRHARGVAHCTTPSILGVAKGVAMGVLPAMGSVIEFVRIGQLTSIPGPKG